MRRLADLLPCRFRGMIRPNMAAGFEDSVAVAERKSADMVEYLRARRAIRDVTQWPFRLHYLAVKRLMRKRHLAARLANRA